MTDQTKQNSRKSGAMFSIGLSMSRDSGGPRNKRTYDRTGIWSGVSGEWPHSFPDRNRNEIFIAKSDPETHEFHLIIYL